MNKATNKHLIICVQTRVRHADRRWDDGCMSYNDL